MQVCAIAEISDRISETEYFQPYILVLTFISSLFAYISIEIRSLIWLGVAR